jgi:hypothetical protein
MTLVDALRSYFQGERALGMFLVVAGLVVLGALYGVWRTQPAPFALGLGVPLVLFALAATAGGAVLERRSADQIARFTIEARERPAELVAAEKSRMARVNANWPRLKIAWIALAIVGFALVNALKRDGATGVGLALVLLAAFLTTVDVFAERRAHLYAAALEAHR